MRSTHRGTLFPYTTLFRSEEVIPQVAEYLHSINQSFCWIPYNRAAGYTKWKEIGIDYAYMQPCLLYTSRCV